MKTRGKPSPHGEKRSLSQIQQVQRALAQAQAELSEQAVEARAGGGAVRIIMTGTLECRSVTIAPGLIDPGDVEMLQDTMVAAINQAIQEAKGLAARRLGPLAGGVVPGA